VEYFIVLSTTKRLNLTRGYFIIPVFSPFGSPVFAVISGLAAATLSYIINTKAIRLSGTKAIIYVAPIIEEFLKTWLAVIFGGSIFVAHMTFGIVEALYDFFNNRGSSAFFAGMAGALSHTLFGVITMLSFRYSGSIIVAIIFAIAAHMFWNRLVTGLKRSTIN
jgi:hypothetical protein